MYQLSTAKEKAEYGRDVYSTKHSITLANPHFTVTKSIHIMYVCLLECYHAYSHLVDIEYICSHVARSYFTQGIIACSISGQ